MWYYNSTKRKGDNHGCGTVYYKGTEIRYSYDDEIGNIRGAVEFLISIGFIDPGTVLIYDNDNSIYEQLNELLEKDC